MAPTTFSFAELGRLWIAAGGQLAAADTAAAIALAESSGCRYAKAGRKDDRPVKTCTYRYTTGENSYGLWQINRDAHPQYSAAELYTPEGNARAAVGVAGVVPDFRPWTTYTSGAYEKYLPPGSPGTTIPPGAAVPPPQPAPAPAPSGGGGAGGVGAANSLRAYSLFARQLGVGLPRHLWSARNYRAATARQIARLAKR